MHELKTWPHFYRAIIVGEKTFEIRKNDRDFKVGDTLVFKEFYPKADAAHGQPAGFSGRTCTVKIKYITDWEQVAGNVVMAIEKVQ